MKNYDVILIYQLYVENSFRKACVHCIFIYQNFSKFEVFKKSIYESIFFKEKMIFCKKKLCTIGLTLYMTYL